MMIINKKKKKYSTENIFAKTKRKFYLILIFFNHLKSQSLKKPKAFPIKDIEICKNAKDSETGRKGDGGREREG